LIHRIKELPHIEFQGENISRIFPAQLAAEFLEARDRPVRSLPDPAGIRIENETLVENLIQNPKNSMMQDSIANCCLVDSSQLWIANGECGIMGMFMGFVFQFVVQSEQIVFQIQFEFQHIRFFHLSATKLPPSGK
jgi:hypothetical protein